METVVNPNVSKILRVLELYLEGLESLSTEERIVFLRILERVSTPMIYMPKKEQYGNAN